MIMIIDDDPHPNLTFGTNKITSCVQVISLVLEMASNANHEMTMI